ncbi:blue-light-activated protein [Geobacter sp. OR-1]|uniref:hybrid sensor histidine kinase/response regulator n=1 Tax=Geobacter sp. OR-1 TaxID=1266765 RepID=UPI000543662A|nr:PAS domain-containing sensor histidine kinase [Geobacter sp. OR-1]GAM09284.1 blue-light-activated protein [Geobacter sp. OR-1]
MIELQQKYRVMFENMPQGVFYQLASGELIDVNPAALELFGLTRDQFMGRTSYDPAWRVIREDGSELPPEHHPSMVALHTGQPVKNFTAGVFNTVRNSWVWLTINAIPMFSEGSASPYQVFVTLHDITERKRAELLLQKESRKYEVLTNTSMDGYWEVDTEGRIISANKTICLMYGYSYDELLTKTLRNFDAIEDNGQLQTHISRIMNSGYDRFETRHYRKDGSAIEVEVSTAFLPEYEIFLAFVRDITEHNRSEKSLRESEFKFRTLFATIQDAIFLTQAQDGRIIECNEKLSGYSRDEIIGRTTEELGLWADIQERLHVVEMVTAHGYIYDYVATFRRKDGSLFPGSISTNAFPLGDKVFLLSVVRDITERKREEQDRLRLEQQLLHAQKLESLGVLAGGIAHDFNNILTAIIGNAELAMMQLNPESPVLENLQRIEKAAGRAADLARQMLAYSGKGKFVVEQIDLNRLVEEMAHMLEVAISKKAILRYNLTRPLPTVEVDATQLRQIVMNLVINASEAIGDNSGVVAITTGCLECDESYLMEEWLTDRIPQGLYVFLEVADTGCGMDAETKTKIFDPFFTTKFTGRGLGMAAVLGIVRGHNGAIKVDSEQGKGSSFKVLLPASARSTELLDNDAAETWRGSGLVLLVDDEETVRAIGSEMLRALGFSVITANDGVEALEKFKGSSNIGVVILDLTMPQMDGEQCFRELRNLNPDISVIMSSGYNEHEINQRFAGKGTAGFIQKPYKLSELKEVLIKAFKVQEP